MARPKYEAVAIVILTVAFLIAMVLLVMVFRPAKAQIPSELVFCITAVDDQGNTSYALAWGELPKEASLYLFRGTDWSFERKIGTESGVYPLEPGFFPWMVPSLGLQGTCGFLAEMPVIGCAWEGEEFVLRWSGLTAPTRLDVLFGFDFRVPYIVGPEDGSIRVGNSSDTYWFAPGFALEGGCTRGTNQVFLPVVKNQ